LHSHLVSQQQPLLQLRQPLLQLLVDMFLSLNSAAIAAAALVAARDQQMCAHAMKTAGVHLVAARDQQMCAHGMKTAGVHLVAAGGQQMCAHAMKTAGVHVESARALMSVHSGKMALLRDRMHPHPAKMALLRLLTAGVVDQDFPQTLRPPRRPGPPGHGTNAVPLRFFAIYVIVETSVHNVC